MPFFRITKAKGGQPLGAVEADDEAGALDAFAMKCGFWDFDDLAASLELSSDKAREGLKVRAAAAPAPDGSNPQPVADFEAA